jgi:beta-fructofuranosidase
MEIFRKMSFADSTGDAIPFYHEGKYHIFSLTSPPGTTVYPARLRTTWSHSVSDDLVHWEELPTALYPGEGDEPDASGVWTGSVIYGEGKYHAFYTGYCLTAEYQQTICHATSDDGITWVKDAANPVITPMIELYEAKAMEAKKRAEEMMSNRQQEVNYAAAQAELAEAIAQLAAIDKFRHRSH